MKQSIVYQLLCLFLAILNIGGDNTFADRRAGSKIRKRPSTASNNVKRQRGRYWRPEDRIEILFNQERQKRQHFHEKSSSYQTGKGRKKNLYHRHRTNYNENNNINAQDQTNKQTIIEMEIDTLRSHNLYRITHKLPIAMQEGYFWAKKSLLHRPFPLTILTVTLQHNEHLPSIVPYLSLALDMLVIDEIHIWPMYARNSSSRSPYKSYTNHSQQLEALQNELLAHKLLGKNDYYTSSSKVRIFHYPMKESYYQNISNLNVHSIHRENDDNYIKQNETIARFENLHSLTNYYQFYAGFGAIRSEDIILRCTEDTVFIDLFHLLTFIDHMQLSLNWYQQNNFYDSNPNANNISAASEINEELLSVAHSLESMRVPSLYDDVKPALYVPNLYDTNYLLRDQIKEPWPSEWIQFPNLPPSKNIGDNNRLLQIHQYFLDNWKSLLFAKEMLSTHIFGPWTRRISRFYLAAQEPSVAFPELMMIINNADSEKSTALPSVNRKKFSTFNDSENSPPSVPLSILASYVNRKVSSNIPTTNNNPLQSKQVFFDEKDHMHPVSFTSVTIEQSTQLFLRPAVARAAVGKDVDQSKEIGDSVAAIPIVECCAINTNSRYQDRYSIPTFSGIFAGHFLSLYQFYISIMSVDNAFYFLHEKDKNSGNFESIILQKYASLGNMQMIAGDMVVMSHHLMKQIVHESEDIDEERKFLLKQETKILAKYRSLAQEYRQFLQQ